MLYKIQNNIAIGLIRKRKKLINNNLLLFIISKILKIQLSIPSWSVIKWLWESDMLASTPSFVQLIKPSNPNNVWLDKLSDLSNKYNTKLILEPTFKYVTFNERPTMNCAPPQVRTIKSEHNCRVYIVSLNSLKLHLISTTL